MTRREADRWAKSYAAGLIESAIDTDTVLLVSAGEDRPEEDVTRIQEALVRLSNQLAKSGINREL